MIQITWLGHGSFHLVLESGETILLDPWLSNPKFPKDFTIDRVDTILVTHGHFDHIHDTVPLSERFNPSVVCIFEIGVWLKGKGVKNVSDMNKGGTQQAGALQVTMTHAVHSCGILDDGKIIYGGEAAGYVLHLPDQRRIYFAGDTNVFSDMELIRELYAPQLAFLPIGDHYTMGPREAAAACRLLRPEQVIPMHFGTFPALTGTPEELQRHLASESGIQILPQEPGKPFAW